MQFKDERDRAVGEERMAHGNAHEDDAIATLLHYRPTLKLRECVLTSVAGGSARSLFHGSQDAAGVDGSGRRVSVEGKCPYGNREPKAYDGVKDYYVPQMCLHMAVEESEYCFFVSWGPATTRIWTVRHNPLLWQRLEEYIFNLMSFSDASLRPQWVLAAAAQIREDCRRVAAASKELAGSPFVSCYAARTPVAAATATAATVAAAGAADSMRDE